VLVAHCPACGFRHGYDNRDARIENIIAEKLSAAKTPAIIPPQQIEEREKFEPKPLIAEAPKYEPPRKPQPVQISRRKVEIRDVMNRVRWARIAIATAIASLVFFLFLGVWQAIPMPGDDAKQLLTTLSARQADIVLDRNGKELTKLGVSAADRVQLSDFQKWQLETLIFSEDKKFYSHNGVDYLAILRAAINNVLRLRYAQGASTITQQLARIILSNRKKNLLRKVHEIRLARALENILPKQKILELYVNNVYLGHGNYSFTSAARFYYDKPLKDLSVNEFISIVALIPSPEKYSPLKYGERLKGRMQELYQNALKAGVIDVKSDEWQKGMASVTEQGERFATETAFGEKSRTGLWPAQFARDFLTQRKILFAENQNSARVYTTIDGALQVKAEELVTKHLSRARKSFSASLRSEDSKEIKEKIRLKEKMFDSGLLLDLANITVARETKPQLQAALVALAPRTGEILAMVGGANFESRNQLNRTIQMRRQTGSAIKPFIYAKAISQHLIHPATLIDDTPYIAGSGSRRWAPENINGGFEGPMPARDALAKSRNIPAIRVGRMLGRELVTEVFSDFFFTDEDSLKDRFSYDETVAIGTISISPLEIGRAFSVFANNGYLTDPLLMTRVETQDKVIDMRKTHPQQLGLAGAPKERLLSAAETQMMISMLKSSGKNSGSGIAGVIGKTGTSSESRDLWFVGGGKEIIVAVWVGYDDMRYAIPGATGSAIAAKLAADLLRDEFVPVEFRMQAGMTRMKVCPATGRIASESCPHARSEVFLSSVHPEGECPHGSAESNEFFSVMGESQFR